MNRHQVDSSMRLIRVQFLHFLFVLITLHSLAVADLNSDRQALLGFSAAVPHYRFLNWTSASSTCDTWVGVSCNLDGSRVVALRLPGVGLVGPIPSNTLGKLDALRVLSLRSNALTGDLPADVSSLPSLRSLFLQHNSLNGGIPTSLSSQLNILDLSFNNFTGNIPQTLSNLTQLTILNLQNNTLYGAIPDLNRTKLRHLNLSSNHLNGSIPSSLQNFPNSSFAGNSLLCGLPLDPCSPVPLAPSPSPSPPNAPPPAIIPPHKKSSKLRLTKGPIIAIAVGGFAVLVLLALIVICCCLKKKDNGGSSDSKGKAVAGAGRGDKPKEEFGSGVQTSEKNKLVFFEGCSYNFDLEDLLRASAEVLGKGSYGTAYKAVLEEATTVVVKRLKEVVVGKKEFEQQMEIVGRVGQHPNVVPLRAYYYSKDEKLLVYDYIPAGSLCTLLHGNRGVGRTPLDWESRIKIALSTAKGIAHLHSAGGPKFSHGNIKTSNVLMNSDNEGCISDFGLAPLMNTPMSASRTVGYSAPEVIETRKHSHKSDVYSFGVLILEMLTMKRGLLCQLFGGNALQLPSGASFRGDINILLVGDPGTSKSQLLQYIHKLSPRGIYTSGRGSSAVGLTAYVSKDPETKETVLESGALVLSDRGICCIDEFDKMSENARSMLHEVMEQQTVSIAKAGIIATLNARTSVLACANPIGSRYNPRLSVIDNIHLPPTLLSRFDLIYLILDKADEQTDRHLARHIVALHFEDPEIAQQGVLDIGTLTTYITYARNHIHPQLSDEAAEELTRGYVEMRRRGNFPGSSKKVITATPRQIESLIRISEALARIRFSEQVEKNDVTEAFRLLEVAMQQSATDHSTGTIDMDLITTGVSASERMRRENLVTATTNIIMEKLQIGGPSMRLMEILEELKKQSSVVDVHLHDLRNAVATMASEGFVVVHGDSVKRA